MRVDPIVAQEIRATQQLRCVQLDLTKVVESYFGKANSNLGKDVEMQFLTDYPYRLSVVVRTNSLDRCLAFVEYSLPYLALQHKYRAHVLFSHETADFIPGVNARLKLVVESLCWYKSWE